MAVKGKERKWKIKEKTRCENIPDDKRDVR